METLKNYTTGLVLGGFGVGLGCTLGLFVSTALDLCSAWIPVFYQHMILGATFGSVCGLLFGVDFRTKLGVETGIALGAISGAMIGAIKDLPTEKRLVAAIVLSAGAWLYAAVAGERREGLEVALGKIVFAIVYRERMVWLFMWILSSLSGLYWVLRMTMVIVVLGLVDSFLMWMIESRQ